MKRTLISLSPDLHHRIQCLAAERGISMSAFVRMALEEKAAQGRPKPKSIGIGWSEYTDTAELAGTVRPEPRSWR